VIVSQVLLDFVNALAGFALSNTKSNLTTCFSSMGITKKLSSRFYERWNTSGTRLSIFGKPYGILHFPALQGAL
jgi:hypothetical protein